MKINIRYAKHSDVEKVVKLHTKTLKSLSSKIGEAYLGKLYTLILNHPQIHIILVAVIGERIIGAISVTKDLNKTKKALFNRELILKTLKAVILARVSIVEVIKRLIEEDVVSNKLEKNSAYIMTLFVDKNYQNQGIGTKLIKNVLRMLKTRYVFVNTLKSNKNAGSFYQALKFKKVGTIINSNLYCYEMS